MRVSRSAILFILGSLTLLFLGASYFLWFYDRLIPFEVGVGNPPTPLAEATVGANGDAYRAVRLTVHETGIMAVTAEELADAGLQFEDLSTSTHNLTHNGHQVPFIVQDDEEGQTLYFYAQANRNPQKALTVYILSSGQGLDMLQRDARPSGEGTPSGQHKYTWEENRFFVEYAPGEDIWMGPLLMAPDSWTYVLDDIIPGEGPAELKMSLFSNAEGSGSPDHHVEILVNGQTVADHTWDGIRHETIKTRLEPGLLVADEVNSISVIVHDNTDITAETIYVDDLELTYEGLISADQEQISFSSDAENVLVSNANLGLMVFDISDPQAPVFLTNLQYGDGIALFAGDQARRQYIALDKEDALQPLIEPVPDWSKPLRAVDREADYIAIVADVRGFDIAIDPLLDFRREKGLRVAKIAVEQIYDEFGAGHRSPEAIKAFLSYAAQHWLPPAPQFVLFVGDATYDVRDEINGKNRNHLPTAMVYTGSGGYLASDAWFTQFGDGGPQMAAGRFPAQNAPQLRAMVRKTLDYEESLASEDRGWRERALVVADDEPIFDVATSSLAGLLSKEGYHAYQLHMSQSDNIRYTIRSLINQGVALVNYVGYGNRGAWGDEAVFQNSDTEALFNESRLPILTAFSSFNGAFAEPEIDCLSESLLRSNSGGVVAAIAPSGRAAADRFLELASVFYKHLLTEENVTVGQVLQELINEGMGEPELRDASLTLNLLGDPALSFDSP